MASTYIGWTEMSLIISPAKKEGSHSCYYRKSHELCEWLRLSFEIHAAATGLMARLKAHGIRGIRTARREKRNSRIRRIFFGSQQEKKRGDGPTFQRIPPGGALILCLGKPCLPSDFVFGAGDRNRVGIQSWRFSSEIVCHQECNAVAENATFLFLGKGIFFDFFSCPCEVIRFH